MGCGLNVERFQMSPLEKSRPKFDSAVAFQSGTWLAEHFGYETARQTCAPYSLSEFYISCKGELALCTT